MDNERLRKEHRKRRITMRMVKDFTMSILILSMSFVMFFGKKIEPLRPIMEERDPFLVNIFGWLCLVYGGFRLFRTITQRDY